jgi:glycerol uptake facilitator-like aquaporin
LEEESIVFVERERRFFEVLHVMASLLVEFLGTAFLVAAVSYVGTPIAIAGALLVALLLSSTAQLNPAITLWAYVSNKIGVNTAVQNMLAQAAGALIVWAVRV